MPECITCTAVHYPAGGSKFMRPFQDVPRVGELVADPTGLYRLVACVVHGSNGHTEIILAPSIRQGEAYLKARRGQRDFWNATDA